MNGPSVLCLHPSFDVKLWFGKRSKGPSYYIGDKVCFLIVCHGVWCLIVLWIWFNRSTFVTVDSCALKCQILFHKYPNPWGILNTGKVDPPMTQSYISTYILCKLISYSISTTWVVAVLCLARTCGSSTQLYLTHLGLLVAGLHILHSDLITDSEQGIAKDIILLTTFYENFEGLYSVLKYYFLTCG